MDIILLLDFSPIKPDFGLMFWTLLLFLLFHFIMKKMAFGPMRDALLKRETDIDTAIEESAKAKSEMANLKSENDKVLTEAREERMAKLKTAKEERTRIINEAKEEAKQVAQKVFPSPCPYDVQPITFCSGSETKNCRLALRLRKVSSFAQSGL